MNKVKQFFSDFKAFITKGNILDMAVGVIVGGAFKDIVNALTNKVLMPLVTMAVPGGLDGFVTVLNPWEAAVKAGPAAADGTPTYLDSTGTAVKNVIEYWGQYYNADTVSVMNWGAIINAAIDFLVIAFIMFIIVRAAMRFQYYSDHAKEISKVYTLEERKNLRKQGYSEHKINKMAEKKLKDDAEVKAKADAEAKAKADEEAKKKADEPVQLLRDIKKLLEEKK